MRNALDIYQYIDICDISHFSVTLFGLNEHETKLELFSSFRRVHLAEYWHYEIETSDTETWWSIGYVINFLANALKHLYKLSKINFVEFNPFLPTFVVLSQWSQQHGKFRKFGALRIDLDRAFSVFDIQYSDQW